MFSFHEGSLEKLFKNLWLQIYSHTNNNRESDSRKRKEESPILVGFRHKMPKKSDKSNANAPEETEDEALKNLDDKRKARLRTRGPYRKASTKNLPAEKS